MLKEFKEFDVKGNVIDLAVGVVVGGAFGSIVTSLVKDIVMPPISIVLGKVDFSEQFLLLKDGKTPGPYTTIDAAHKAGAITLNYGSFLNNVLSFLIVAFSIFLVVKAINRFKRQEAISEEISPPALTKQEELLTEIRDSLRDRKV